MPDEEAVYSAHETNKENKQSYNNFERILFLLILLVITFLSFVIAVPLFVLAQVRALLLPKKTSSEKTSTTAAK